MRAIFVPSYNFSKNYFPKIQEDERPQKALPLLEQLAARPSPKGAWLIALSNTHLMLDAIVPAARAMERAAGVTRKGKLYRLSHNYFSQGK